MECPVTRPRPSTNELLRLALAGLVMLSLGLAASTAAAEDEESDDKTGSLYVEYLAAVWDMAVIDGALVLGGAADVELVFEPG